MSQNPKTMRIFHLVFFIIFNVLHILHGQNSYWQMAVKYNIDIELITSNHQYSGREKLILYNNSPDVLDRLFYHMYMNAFQPGSDMDIRSRTLPDPDKRVGDRIYSLKKDEIGYIRPKSIVVNNVSVPFKEHGTILEVNLVTPIAAGDSVEIVMDFEAQVPIQIRRNGRDNSEGINYSMAQWYPKLCNYDTKGWHANPYIGREFYGIWGDFHVNITLPDNYCVAATGYLQGSADCNNTGSGKQKQTWSFYAPKVHDFVWAADPDYIQENHVRNNGQILKFYYQEGDKTKEWKKLPILMDSALIFIERNFGQYPYNSYSFIQGGDGGMEYPMATLITGNRSLNSLVGVSLHELMHTWYQMILATNEAEYAWMDEGFTSYAEYKTTEYLKKINLLPNNKLDSIPFLNSIKALQRLVESGVEESLTTHADHFETNFAYGTAAYVKGSLTLAQLEYILGEENVKKGLLEYYNKWKFKHPTDYDFFRVMERVSGCELDWFHEYWVETTKFMEYGIDSVYRSGKSESAIILKRNGSFPMPVEVKVELKNGSVHYYYIPLDLMRGKKPLDPSRKYELLNTWKWVSPTYEFTIPVKSNKIKFVTIDPDHRTADMIRENNQYSILEND